MRNGTEVPVKRCITAGVTAAAALIVTVNWEQTYTHFSCINLCLSLWVTSAPEQAGSEMCLHGDLNTAHFIN